MTFHPDVIPVERPEGIWTGTCDPAANRLPDFGRTGIPTLPENARAHYTAQDMGTATLQRAAPWEDAPAGCG